MIAVRAHKLRAGLTVLGIVVGVATVIAMVSIVTGFNNNMVRNFQAFGATLVQFQKFSMRFGPGHRSDHERNRKDLTLEDALALKAQIPEIRAVSPERYLFDGTDAHVKYRDTGVDRARRSRASIPTTRSRTTTSSSTAASSPTPTSSTRSQVAVIGTDVQKALFPRESPLDKTVELNGWKYVVVGVMEEKGDFGGGSSNHWFFIPFSAFDRQFPQIKNEPRRHDPHRDRPVHARTRSPTVIEKGRALLRARRAVPFNAEDDFYILTPDKMIESFQGITRGITGAMVFIAFISLLIGGVGVMNIMLVSVTERTREIGVRKAVGAFRRDIVLQFLTEATTLALLGGIIGVVVGVAVPAGIKAAFAALAGGDARSGRSSSACSSRCRSASSSGSIRP